MAKREYRTLVLHEPVQRFNAALQPRLSRRRALAGALAGGTGLVAMAAGCSSSKTSTAKRPAAGVATPQPKRGGTLIDPRFQVLTGRTMDPHIDTPTSDKSRRQWYQGLLDYNVLTLDLVPEVAQKWEQPSTGELVFHLQPGVKWHNKPPANGRLLTADDVVFSLNRVRTNDPKFQNRSVLDTVDQITAPDQATVRMTVKQPDAVLLTKFASDGMLLLAPEVVAKAQKFSTADEVVGTGAFIMKSLQDQVGSDSVRNPDYWKPGLPYLDGYSYRYFGDNQQAYAALLAKQVDIADVSGANKQDYLSRQPKDYQPRLAKAVIGAVPWLMPNLKAKPLDDPRLGKALRLLADFQELRDQHGKVWFPDAEYGSVLSTALDKWDLSLDEYDRIVFWQQPKDAAVKQALDLLQAAGYSKDNPLSFEVIVQANAGDEVPPAFAQLLQAEWRKFGGGAVNAQLKILPGPQAQAQRTQGTYTYILTGLAGAFDDPDAFFDLVRSKSSRNFTGFSDPEIDALMEKQRVTFDAAQRMSLVKQSVRLLAERSPTVIPYRVFYLNGESARLRNHLPEGGVTMGQEFESVWLDTNS